MLLIWKHDNTGFYLFIGWLRFFTWCQLFKNRAKTAHIDCNQNFETLALETFTKRINKNKQYGNVTMVKTSVHFYLCYLWMYVLLFCQWTSSVKEKKHLLKVWILLFHLRIVYKTKRKDIRQLPVEFWIQDNWIYYNTWYLHFVSTLPFIYYHCFSLFEQISFIKIYALN